MVDLRPAVDETPEQFRKARAFFRDLEVGLCAGDRTLDLGAIANDAGIVHQRMNFFRVVARDLLRLKVVESFAKIFALAQDRDPGQPGLKAVEDEFFVQGAVVIFRHAPFGVVIGHIKRVFAGPRAPRQAIGVQTRRSRHATFFGTARRSSRSARRMASPPAVSGVPASRASETRSVRIRARPLGPAVEPMVPTGLAPARITAPGSGEKPSRTIRTVRVRAVPRCCIRDTTSWPT